jgi:hypothetical protein
MIEEDNHNSKTSWSKTITVKRSLWRMTAECNMVLWMESRTTTKQKKRILEFEEFLMKCES